MSFRALLVVTLHLLAAAHLAVAFTPCDNKLCTCFGGEAVCSPEPQDDLSMYGLEYDVQKLRVDAPFSSLCDTVKNFFPNANEHFTCHTKDSEANSAGTVMAYRSTADLDSLKAASEEIQRKLSTLIGELPGLHSTDQSITHSVSVVGATSVTLPVTSTEPATVTSTDPPTVTSTEPSTVTSTEPSTVTSTMPSTVTSTVTSTEPSTTPSTVTSTTPSTVTSTTPSTVTSTVTPQISSQKPISELTKGFTPRKMVYKSKSGELKRCIVTSYKCQCDACAKNCPCPTPTSCAPQEKCTPQIIWISPSPPNATTPAFAFPGKSTTPLTTPLPSTSTTTTPTIKCDFMEAAQMVWESPTYLDQLCEHRASLLENVMEKENGPAISVTHVTAVTPETTTVTPETTTVTTETTTTTPETTTVTPETTTTITPETTTVTTMEHKSGDGINTTLSHTTAPSATTDGIKLAPVVRRHSAKLEMILDKESEKVERVLAVVERILMIMERIEMYTADWYYKTTESAFQAGTNLLLFIAAYTIQIVVMKIRNMRHSASASLNSSTPRRMRGSGGSVPTDTIVYSRPPRRY